MDPKETLDSLCPFFPQEVQQVLRRLTPGELREIRLRSGHPGCLITSTGTQNLPWTPDQRDLETLTEALSDHSLYARAEETGQGYLTLRGGHRMGLCGRVTVKDGVATLREIASICIRIAGAWNGVADRLLPLLRKRRGVGSALIIGIPGSGKTTLLRDVARQLSYGGVQVALIDERGELAASVSGVPQMDVGPNTDVLCGLNKGQAVPWLIRSMGPQLIVTDELSGPEDAVCLLDAHGCGASVCASVHGSDLGEVANRPAFASLMARRVFDVYAILSPEGGARIAALYDRSGSPLPLT